MTMSISDEREKLQKRIEQLQAREKQLAAKEKEKERKARTKRLIELGASVESKFSDNEIEVLKKLNEKQLQPVKKWLSDCYEKIKK